MGGKLKKTKVLRKGDDNKTKDKTMSIISKETFREKQAKIKSLQTRIEKLENMMPTQKNIIMHAQLSELLVDAQKTILIYSSTTENKNRK
jgi:hypothetical protein